MIGQKFGRLTVLGITGKDKRGECLVRTLCDCGKEVTVRSWALKNRTRSCGCLRLEKCTTHGMYGTPEYTAWSGMIYRCENPKDNKYHIYGGKGITVCSRWRSSFSDFFQDMGPKPSPKHSLDRFPNRKGNYEPGNVRWASYSQQNRNREKMPSRSIFRGVHPSSTPNKWTASLWLNGKSLYLGTCSDEVDAATVYNFAAYKYFGDEAIMNSPECLQRAVREI